MKRILYIAGARHCGSTILDLVLGEHPAITSLGQAAAIHRYFDGTETCTCGAALAQCPVWGVAMGNLTEVQREALRRWGPVVMRERGMPQLLRSRQARAGYAAAFDPLHEQLFELTGSDVLVDSSKNVTRAVALALESRYPVTVLHLVRDARGMINSHNRRRRRHSYREPMGEWLLKNGLASIVARPLARGRYLSIRYENLILQPEETLRAVGAAVDLDLGPLSELVRSGRQLGDRHIFRGNTQVREQAVSFDSGRLRSQRLPDGRNGPFWLLGGAVTSAWGYDRRQSYLEGARVPTGRPRA